MLAVYQKGNYLLQDEAGREAGQLVREGTFSFKVHIETAAERFDFVKKGLFSNTRINRNGREIGEVKMDWKSMVFKLDLGSRIHQYRLCQKSVWNSTFLFKNELNNELMQIVPLFRWRKMNYDYQIEINSRHSEVNSSLVLLAVYGVRKMLEHQYAAS